MAQVLAKELARPVVASDPERTIADGAAIASRQALIDQDPGPRRPHSLTGMLRRVTRAAALCGDHLSCYSPVRRGRAC
ncbi:hypothetical protein [Nocardia niigatensis]|uniref:hypothetical protein n=1 Tax=Nocardia niigatensis TaxID=209249 RepID=UPI0015774FFD|nr:hypothetical protein [Nocardia niigatensis]